MLKRILILFLLLACAGMVHAQTWTYTATSAPTAVATPTQTYTATASLASANVLEYTIVNNSPNGVTKTSLPSTWVIGHYRLGIVPVNYVPTTSLGSYNFNYQDHGVTATGMTTGYVSIGVTDAQGGKIPLTSHAVTFHFSIWRKNND